jgi:type II pantothenate kinase
VLSDALAIGIDAGATLAKLAFRWPGRDASFELVPAGDLSRVVEYVRREPVGSIGLTGGGAAELARLLERDTAHVNEFAAWGFGAAELLRCAGLVPDHRFLLVSLGTGTSIMLVDGMSVTRVGGTALGGGTIVGLGTLLAGDPDFETLAARASRGDRRHVDLLVRDIYRAGEIPLMGDLTACNFGRLARSTDDGGTPAPDDLAHALMGLVGENVALICGGLAAAAQVRRVVYAGSTLRGNSALIDILRAITGAIGREAVFLPGGEFAGALGALLYAEQRPV